MIKEVSIKYWTGVARKEEQEALSTDHVLRRRVQERKYKKMKDKKTLKLNLLTLLVIASILLYFVAFPFILDAMFPEPERTEEDWERIERQWDNGEPSYPDWRCN